MGLIQGRPEGRRQRGIGIEQANAGFARFQNGDAAPGRQIKLEAGREIVEGEPEETLQQPPHLAALAGESLGEAGCVEGEAAAELQIGGGA